MKSTETLNSSGGLGCGVGSAMITTHSFGGLPFIGTPDFMAAIMQGDGNFVVYFVEGHTIGSQKLIPKWDSKTENQGQGPYTLHLDDAGLLQVKDSTGTALWTSAATQKRPVQHAPCHLTIQQDGNLVVYDAGGLAIWASDTNGQAHG